MNATRKMRQNHMGFPLSPKPERQAPDLLAKQRKRYESGVYKEIVDFLRVGDISTPVKSLKANGFGSDFVCEAIRDLTVLGIIKIRSDKGERVIYLNRMTAR